VWLTRFNQFLCSYPPLPAPPTEPINSWPLHSRGSEKWNEKHGVITPVFENPDLVYSGGECQVQVNLNPGPLPEGTTGMPAPLFLCGKTEFALDFSDMEAHSLGPSNTFNALWKCKGLDRCRAVDPPPPIPPATPLIVPALAP
jgi:hypothetical protein